MQQCSSVLTPLCVRSLISVAPPRLCTVLVNVAFVCLAVICGCHLLRRLRIWDIRTRKCVRSTALEVQI
jgi:hypothetical protein